VPGLLTCFWYETGTVAYAARRRAAKLERPFPGTGQCCPKCHGGRVVVHDTLGYSELKFYWRQIATCADCRTAWEPVDESLVSDRSDARASFTQPCDNCAFRPGSPEKADTAKLKEMIASLRAGASFHCHKGVPLAPDSEHGFAYPQDRRRQSRTNASYGFAAATSTRSANGCSRHKQHSLTLGGLTLIMSAHERRGSNPRSPA